MAGYIGSKSSVTQVDGYTEAEADAEFVTKTGDTMSGDLSLGDNDKAIFGAGSDLQIYHNGGSGNFIDSVNKDLYLRCNLDAGITGGDIAIQPKAGENSAVFRDNAGAELYYDNSKKLETTSTGVDVTGTVDSDGLTVSGTPVRFNSTAPMLNFMEVGVADSNHRIRQNSGNLYIQKLSDDEGTATDRLIIDGGSGNVGIGTTTGSAQLNVDATGDKVTISARVNANGDSCFQPLNASGTAVGNIIANASSTAYNTSSDYRLKENVVDLTGASARVNQLNPSRFNFISDADKTVDGFLAHEVATVVPEAINGTKDAMRDEEYEVTPAVEATYDEDGNELTAAVEAVMGTRSVPDYQGIDQSKLVPLLTAALQEALTEIASLKTRVEALEA